MGGNVMENIHAFGGRMEKQTIKKHLQMSRSKELRNAPAIPRP